MSQKRIDQILEKWTDPSKRMFNGVTFIAVDDQGNTLYKGSAGKLRFDPEDHAVVQPDSLCWIASMTKVVTAVAVMQLVERGLLDLERDVREIVPALKDLEVLVGFEEGKPIMEKIKGKLTIPHLLTHTSGFWYDRHPDIMAWSESVGRTDDMWDGSMKGYLHPILFQPGTNFGYGPGVDWAGQAVEKVTGMTLEDYMHTHIWSPLGAHHTTFHPERRPAGSLPPKQQMGHRPGGPMGFAPLGPGPTVMRFPLTDDLGGIGLHSTATDFVRLLSALLRGGAPLLGPEALDALLRPRLDRELRKLMLGPLGARTRRVVGVAGFEEERVDYCFAGTVTMVDLPGRRKKGSASWAGLPNLHWWIDRESGIAGTLFTQIMPPGDEATVDLLLELETAVYDMVKEDNTATETSRL